MKKGSSGLGSTLNNIGFSSSISYASSLGILQSAWLVKNCSFFDTFLDYLTVTECTVSLALN